MGINAFADGHGHGYKFAHTFQPLGEISVDVRALHAMSPSGVPLLCNLRQLAFSDDPDSMKIARFLLAPTIKTVHLDFVSDIFNVYDAATFFTVLNSRCPFLEHLEFCRIPRELSPTVSQFVCGWENLQTFLGNYSGHGVTDEALIHLASLPTLSRLKINLKHNSLPLALPPQPFPGLRDFTLSASHVGVVIDLLKSHHVLPLQSLTLDFNITATALTELLHVMRDHCAHSCLTRLFLRYDFDISNASDVIDPDTLRPLLAFTNLARLDLDCSYDVEDVDDTLLEEMAAAWPRLERLMLGPNRSSGRSSHVTLAGLVPLARYCPQLEFFSLPFDTSSMERPGTKFRNRQLTELGVGCSRIADATAVAEFLSDIFPNLRSIYWRTTSGHHRDDGERWAEVTKKLMIWRED